MARNNIVSCWLRHALFLSALVVFGCALRDEDGHIVGGISTDAKGGVSSADVKGKAQDGSVRTVRQASAPTVGARVRVDGNVLHAAPDAQG